MSTTTQQRVRVALVNPLGKRQTSMPVPPLGLAALVKYYQLKGAQPAATDFRIFDENVRREQVNAVAEWDPDLVGIGCMSLTRGRAFEFAEALRKLRPDAFLLGGGVHFQVCPEDGARNGPFDAVCTGEGEETLRQLIDGRLRGEGVPFDAIPNLAWRGVCGEFKTSPRWSLTDLEHVPLPDMERFDLKYYFAKRQFIPGVWARSTSVLSSRGCPFRCAFCFNSFREGRVRYHAIGEVVDHILRLRDCYGLRHFGIADDLFLMNRARVAEFCDLLEKRGADVRWSCNARPSVMRRQDAALLRRMRECGCLMLAFGFESGSDAVLKRIKGPDASVQKNQEALDVAHEVGMPVFGYFMVGIPGETETEMEMTGDFIRRNLDKLKHFEMFIYTPFPGAELSEEVKRQGLLDGVAIEDLALNIFAEGQPRVFNSAVPADRVLRFRRELKRLTMSRFPLHQKLRWLLSEGLDNPVRTFRRLKALYFPGGTA